jgi:hypothetical protein
MSWPWGVRGDHAVDVRIQEFKIAKVLIAASVLAEIQ